MKKVKNAELKESKSSLEDIQEGKVKKKKQKLNKKLQNETNNKTTNIGVQIKKKNNKSTKQIEKQEEHKFVDNGGKIKKNEQEKSKNNKEDSVGAGTPSRMSVTLCNDLTKKNIKELKLKDHQEKVKKKAAVGSISEVQKLNTLDTVNAAGNKLLTKKKKKAEKKRLILTEKQNRDPTLEASTVFVGNLPVNTKRIQLVRLFTDFAPINSIRFRTAGGKVLNYHKQRKSASSLNAYVVLNSKESAEKAISLNGTEFKGNHLRVTLAVKDSLNREKEDAKRTVFVGNLKYSATEESLRELFSSCGEIDYVRCIRDGDKGCKGVAYVCFKTADAVSLALELKGTIVDERPINVERFSTKKLGAREAREAQIIKEAKCKNNSQYNPKEKDEKGAQHKQSKKSEFRGVKVKGFKNNRKSKKKKNNHERQLAKKFAQIKST